MGTLASELGPHAARISGQPRVYVDANVPARLVAFMREALQWDALFVIEHDDLRRARDGDHYRLARQLRRTLITFDRDYLDDRKFPMDECSGVIVLTAPDEHGYGGLLKRLDRDVFRSAVGAAGAVAASAAVADARGVPQPADLTPLPLERRKLHVHVDWKGPR
jgi:predicted nuclease of predicted toxin-antitoxin system